MNINNHIYIYYIKNPNNEVDTKESILLKDYQEYLNEASKNKEKIINIFEKKFINDFIESIDILLENFKLYSISLIITSAIDVLAKHYTGNTSNSNIGANYQSFFDEFLKKFFNLTKISSEITNDFYNNFRCSITHSNSTKIEITIDNDTTKNCFEQDGKIILNLMWLNTILEKILYEYLSELKNNDTLYNKFIEVQKVIYF